MTDTERTMTGARQPGCLLQALVAIGAIVIIGVETSLVKAIAEWAGQAAMSVVGHALLLLLITVPTACVLVWRICKEDVR